MKKELIKQAKAIFEQYDKENVLYCIDNGNFWFEKDKILAEMYSKKLGKEVLIINKSETVEKPVAKKRKSKTKNKK